MTKSSTQDWTVSDPNMLVIVTYSFQIRDSLRNNILEIFIYILNISKGYWDILEFHLNVYSVLFLFCIL